MKNVTSPQSYQPLGNRLAKKRYSVRVPIDIAARVEALCELHPDRSRSQLLCELLREGLQQTQRLWREAKPAPQEWLADHRQRVHLVSGPFAEFRGLSYKHHLAMERERTDGSDQSLPPVDEYLLADLD